MKINYSCNAIWVNLTNLILSEKSMTLKNTNRMVPLTCTCKISKTK